MTVGFKIRGIISIVGTSDFLYSFFSTVSFHLEPNGWGSKFPMLLNKLYQDKLLQEDSIQSLDELLLIQQELKKYPPDAVVWNLENLNLLPPWGNNISTDITDLSNYFVTSTGKDLIQLLQECIELLRDRGGTLEIVRLAE